MKPKFIAGAVLAAILLSGCQKSGDASDSENSGESGSTSNMIGIEEIVPVGSDWLPDPVDEWKQNGTVNVEVINNAMNGVQPPIYHLTFTSEDQIIGFNPAKPVVAGQTLTGSVLAWTDADEQEIRIRIARYCGNETPEQTVKTRNLGVNVITAAVSHTFESDQKCARLQIDSRKENADFYIAAPQLGLE